LDATISLSNASKPGGIRLGNVDRVADYERPGEVAECGEHPQATNPAGEGSGVTPQEGRGHLHVDLGEQHRSRQHHDEEAGGEAESFEQTLNSLVLRAGRDQCAEQCADGDEAAGEHAEHDHLRHGPSHSTLGADLGHLEHDQIRRQELVRRRLLLVQIRDRFHVARNPIRPVVGSPAHPGSRTDGAGVIGKVPGTPVCFRRMTVDQLIPLTNDAWGIESSCFVCEPRNESGLGIPFHHDVAGECVLADFALDERFSGAPRYVHGGVLLAILDEAMAWATIAVGGCFAVTRETTSRFEHPVRVGEEHSVRAEIVEQGDRVIHTRGTITCANGRRCVTASATFAMLDLEQAGAAAGAEITGDAVSYTLGGGR
jgi:acyl-coenzyme A thioesterase PaaI-like protein